MEWQQNTILDSSEIKLGTEKTWLILRKSHNLVLQKS